MCSAAAQLASDSGGDPAAILVGTSIGYKEGYMKGSRDAGWGVGVRETSGGRGSTAVRGMSVAMGTCGSRCDSRLAASSHCRRAAPTAHWRAVEGVRYAAPRQRKVQSAPTSIVVVGPFRVYGRREHKATEQVHLSEA